MSAQNFQLDSLQENITRTQVLQKDIDHLSIDVSKITKKLDDFGSKIDKLDKMLDKSYLKSEEDYARREATEKSVLKVISINSELEKKTLHHEFLIIQHEKKHEDIEPRISRIESKISETSTIKKFINFSFYAIIAIISAWFALDAHNDRNADRLEKAAEKDHLRKIEILQEEQKKKHQEDLMAKYKIRAEKEILLNEREDGK